MPSNLKGESSNAPAINFYILSIMIVVGAIYVLSMPIKFCMGDPASEIANTIGTQSIRASHLLTTPTYAAILNINSFLGVFSRGFILAQLFNIILGLGSAFILYSTQICLGVSKRIATYLSLLFLLSNGVWNHSVTAETGIHSLFFLTISLYFIIKFIIAPKPKSRQAIYSFIGLCIGALFSINIVLFIPGILIAIFIKLVNFEKNKLIKIYLGLLIIFLALIITPFYLASSLVGINSFVEFIGWLTNHPEALKLSHLHRFGIELILRPFSGIIALFVNPGQAINVLKATIQGVEIAENIWAELPFLIFSLFLVTAFVLLSLYGLFKITNRALQSYFIISLLFLFLFNSYWLGSDPQFWLPALPLILLLMGLGSMSLKMNKYLKITCLIIPFLMTYYNLPTEIPSLFSPRGGKDMHLAYEFVSKIQNPSVIFTPGNSWPDFVKEVSNNKDNVISLVYSDVDVDNDFFRKIDKQIADSIQQGKLVFFDDLLPPLHAKQIGYWKMVKSTHGVSRENLLTYLKQKYKVETTVPGLSFISNF